MKIYLESYGCSANQSDSEIMLGILKQKGHKIVSSPKQSDINILNTCIVKSPTENRMKFRIKELSGKPLVVAGCMSSSEKEIIENINPKASLIGPDSIHSICEAAEKAFNGKKIVAIDAIRKPKVCLPKIRRNPAIDIIQISTGCLGNCYYCQTKFAKGRLFSYPSSLITKQVKSVLTQGVKEFWLTSQDTGCYGKDASESLPELLKKATEIPGKFLVRVGMMNPNHTKKILNELIEAYKSEKIFKFIHIPVQSGSDRILKKMNRNYTISDFKHIIDAFRKQFPMITLSTDIIAGYPGETEKDFQQTINLLKEVKPDIVNISKYWPRPKTEASQMKQLKREAINKRTQKLSILVKEIQFEKNKHWLGWEGEVLIDERGKKGMISRNIFYKPIVTKGKLGCFRKVRIKNAYATYLKGF